jgi:hypothetical protein
MLYIAGASDRFGKVSDGNTVMDFDAEEKRRHNSVASAVCPLEWRDRKINIIDTPGLFDFATGVSEGIRAAETVLIVTKSGSGVGVGVGIGVEVDCERTSVVLGGFLSPSPPFDNININKTMLATIKIPLAENNISFNFFLSIFFTCLTCTVTTVNSDYSRPHIILKF